MKKIFFLFITLISCAAIKAQELPDIIGPSPETALIHRFDEQPVSLFTGVPKIEVPIYTIKVDGLTIPITLRYHASGIKIADESGSFGLGWALNAGGRISRTIKDKQDKTYPFGPKKQDELELMTFLNFHTFMGTHNTTDFERDVFSYGSPTASGKFILKELDTVVTIPYEPVDISWSHSSLNSRSNATFDYFELLDSNGNFFRYGEPLNNSSVHYTEADFHGQGPQVNPATSWLMTEAITANKKDTIFFNYQNKYLTRDLLREQYEITHKPGNSCAVPGGTLSYFTEHIPDSGNHQYNSLTFNEIIYKNLKIEFIMDPSINRIKTVKIWNTGNNELQKKIELYYNDFAGSSRYTLQKVGISDKGDAEVYEYSFDYNNGTVAFPDSDSANFDHWGYYNNKSNTLSYPSLSNLQVYKVLNSGSATTINVNGANKEADETAMKHSVLTDMHLPTGGKIHYEYEAHKSSDYLGATILGGGLRIKNVTFYEDLSISKKVSYKYGVNEDGKGYRYVEPSLDHYMTNVTLMDYYKINNDNFHMQAEKIIISATASVNYFPHGSAVVYPHVTTYTEDISGNSQGKTEYVFTNDDNDNAETSIRELVSNEFDMNLNPYSYFESEIRNKGVNGNPKFIKYFKRNIDNSYSIVKKDSLNYATFNESTHHSLINRIYLIDLDDPLQYFSDPYAYDPTRGCSYDFDYRYSFADSYVNTGATRLQSKSTKLYDEQEDVTLTQTSSYQYDNLLHLLPTTVETLDSKGNKTLIKTRYPDDFDSTSKLIDNSTIKGGSLTSSEYSAIGAMKSNDLHQVSTPIQVETYKDVSGTETLLTINRTNFDEWSTDVILPESIETSKGTTSLEDRITYDDYYSNGNVKEVLKTDGTHIVYIWGYNEQYPIAKIENAEYSDISSTVYSGILSKSDLDDSDSDEDILRSELDKLRDPVHSPNLTDAMVTTYTYDPLIGVTSITDPKGVTVYYEYDDFNRLQYVKDTNGKILSKNEYHYKGQ